MTRALLGRFRSTWLDSPLPMVVEHGPDRPETICAAPSLWMGGKLVAERLREAGLGPGDRVAYVGEARAGYVQALVGCLRVGVTFLPREIALAEHEAHATVSADLAVTRGALSPRGDEELRMLLRASDTGAVVGLRGDDLDALATDAALLLPGDGVRIGGRGEWTEWRSVALEVLGGLFVGAEIHVVGAGVTREQLAATGSLPNVVVHHADGAAAVPAEAGGVAICIGQDAPRAEGLFDVAISPRREIVPTLQRIGVT
jgi:hypothetical protein